MDYRVRVWDNYHYGDDDESYEAGTYETYEEALEAAKQIVKKSVLQGYKPGISPEALWQQYSFFGEDPSVLPGSRLHEHFSAWEYAKSLCYEVCGRKGQET